MDNTLTQIIADLMHHAQMRQKAEQENTALRARIAELEKASEFTTSPVT